MKSATEVLQRKELEIKRVKQEIEALRVAAQLLRENPALAAACVELPPATLKGIRSTVRIYEVPWK